MKVFTFVLALGTVSALGSGPYLPSGWKPQGPAFLLPSEAQKPAPEPLYIETQSSSVQPSEEAEKVDLTTHSEDQDIIQGSEASGSDFLREYGPPKGFDFKTITEQALPELDTERPFATTEKSGVEVKETLDDKTEVKYEPEVTQDSPSSAVKSETEEVNTTESLVTDKIYENITTEKVESISVGEGTSKSSFEDAESKEIESNLVVKSGEDTQVKDAASLEYLPPVNEIENSAEALALVKSGNAGQEDDASSLEYLPPAVDAEEKIEDATPLYQANLETGFQGNPGVNAEKFPPINEVEQNVNNDKKNEVSNIIESEKELKPLEDAIIIDAKTTMEEGSGWTTLKEEAPVGFREYGPPRVSDAEKKSETRRRRFSSKFVPSLNINS